MKVGYHLRTPGGEPLLRTSEGSVWSDAAPEYEHPESAGWWALPGLVDAHAHLAQDSMVLEPGNPDGIRSRARTYLRSGVTLVHDKGWSDLSVLSVLAVPHAERPDIEAAGRMIATPGGYFPGFAVEVEDDRLSEAVETAAAESAGWVKIVGDWPRRGLGALANFSEEALAGAVDAAHRAGARVAVHTMARDVPSMAVHAGVDSIEHGLFLTDDDVRALGDRGGMWVPTVLRVEEVIREVGPERTGGRLLAEGLDRVRSLLPTARSHGVQVMAGTDLAVAPGKVAREALRLIDYGLSAHDAIEALGRPGGFLSGSPADAVFFDRNPLEDPTVLLRPVAVLRHGLWVGSPSQS